MQKAETKDVTIVGGDAKESPSTVIGKLKSGDSFDELVKTNRRGASITTLTRTEFLLVHRDDFIQITTTMPDEAAVGKRAVLERHELMLSLKADSNALIGLCDIVDFKQDETILTEKTRSDSIFIVL